METSQNICKIAVWFYNKHVKSFPVHETVKTFFTVKYILYKTSDSITFWYIVSRLHTFHQSPLHNKIKQSSTYQVCLYC